MPTAERRRKAQEKVRRIQEESQAVLLNLDSQYSGTMEFITPEGNTWDIEFIYKYVRGVRTLVGFHIVASDKNPDAELTHETFRSVQIKTLFIQWLASTKKDFIVIDPSFVGPKKGILPDAEYLQLIKDLYAEALDFGLQPNNYIADKLQISHSAAKKRVNIARENGYLPIAHKGAHRAY